MNPPVIAIAPGAPFAEYGLTLGEQAFLAGDPGATYVTEYSFVIVILFTLATSLETSQQVTDSYLGMVPGNTASIPGAVGKDPTLGGAVDFCEVIQVLTYGQIDWAGQQYFGARVQVKMGVS